MQRGSPQLAKVRGYIRQVSTGVIFDAMLQSGLAPNVILLVALINVGGGQGEAWTFDLIEAMERQDM